MTIEPSEHPATVDVYEVKDRRLSFGLALVGALAFVALGVWLALDAPGLVAKAVGAMTAIFFGWCAVVAVQRMRHGVALQLSHQGIHYAFAPNYATRKLIAWRDVEGFDIWRLSGNETNSIRLARYDSLVTEAAQTVVRFARLARLAEIAGAGGNGAPIASLENMLRFNREMYGGEICLGWAERDRGATDFQELLTVWKEYCTGADGTHV